jgi:hypothetical protein
MSDQPVSDSLEAIYAKLPELRCQGKCQEACGPVFMSPAEEVKFRMAGKVVPDPVKMLRSDHAECPHLPCRPLHGLRDPASHLSSVGLCRSDAV